MTKDELIEHLKSPDTRARIAAIVDARKPRPEGDVREAAIDAIIRWLCSIAGDVTAMDQPGSDDEAIQRRLSSAVSQWVFGRLGAW